MTIALKKKQFQKFKLDNTLFIVVNIVTIFNEKKKDKCPLNKIVSF